ncbi:hypothetical protein K439DRAFT_439082 [Ramaria rubella]|nr:hypothetical protein K439DRAFT_439082 [Ramaria rubella]
MFSHYPSAQYSYPSRYYTNNDDYLARDYFHTLAQQQRAQERQRQEAQYRAQLEEARRRQAYEEHLAREAASRRRRDPFQGEHEPYGSYLRPARRGYPHTRHDFLEDLIGQQMETRREEDERARSQDRSQSSPGSPGAVPEAKKSEEQKPSSSSNDACETAARKIQSFFEDIKASFEFPLALDFADADVDADVTPTLLYTPRNAPLHGHEHALVKLLSGLDAVESHGDARVRRVRKELVRRIESELGVLDAKKAEVWRFLVSQRGVDSTMTGLEPDGGAEKAAQTPLPASPASMDLDLTLLESEVDGAQLEEDAIENELIVVDREDVPSADETQDAVEVEEVINPLAEYYSLCI